MLIANANVRLDERERREGVESSVVNNIRSPSLFALFDKGCGRSCRERDFDSNGRN